MTRIIILGFMGAGKTLVGRCLAKALALPFYDLDWYISNRMRQTVKEIFDSRGEDGFRRIERTMLHEVAEFEDVVISCGGGTPCFFDNMESLNQQGQTVYLKATPDVLMAHLRMGKGVRPLLLGKTEDEKRAYITEQLSLREPYYSKAQYTLCVDQMKTYEDIDTHAERLQTLLAAPPTAITATY